MVRENSRWYIMFPSPGLLGGSPVIRPLSRSHLIIRLPTRSDSQTSELRLSDRRIRTASTGLSELLEYT